MEPNFPSPHHRPRVNRIRHLNLRSQIPLPNGGRRARWKKKWPTSSTKIASHTNTGTPSRKLIDPSDVAKPWCLRWPDSRVDP